MATYDLIVIGAGWAGFNAALKARKLGKSVCLIEKDKTGGTCLNRGCIPTKVLTHFAKENCQASVNFSTFKKDKEDTITKLKNGIEFSLKSQKIDLIKGTAKIISPNKVFIKEENKEVEAKFILVAVGSEPRDLPFLKFDHSRILSSNDILELDSLPKSLLVIGGGVIGCEFACALNKLGVKVAIAEIIDRLVFMFDVDISKKIEQVFKKSGITVNTSYDIKDKDLSEYDKVLLCVGRKTNLSELFGPSLKIEVTKEGCIKTDSNLKTSIPNIFAAGDCIGGLQLAHVASYEAKLAVSNMFKESKEADYSSVPSSVFTTPELAQVGLNEGAAKQQSINIKVIKRPFTSVGMAYIFKETDGFLKLILGQDKSTLLGAGIVGPLATELINTLALAVKCRLTSKDASDLIFAHPSISEIFTESIQS
ncbi:MAG: dihydrolipoyl dehydrogenase [Candidatus Omnitrophota bacterium]